MKKFFLLAFAVVFSVIAFAQTDEQDVQEMEGAAKKSEKNYMNFNHWMLSAGGGFNMFFVERQNLDNRPFYDVAKNCINNFTGAAYVNIGYMFNPAWGIVAEAAYTPVSKNLCAGNGERTGLGFEGTLQFDFNLLNICQRYRSNPHWNVDLLVGAGGYAYNSRFNDGTYGLAIAIPVTLQAMYCPIEELGISLRFTGKWFSNDNINKVASGANNDLGFFGGLGLHYNITTPGKHHVRMMDMYTYEKAYEKNVVVQAKNYDAEIEEQKKALEKTQAELKRINEEIAKLNSKSNNQPMISTSSVEKVPADYATLKKDVEDMKSDIETLRQQIMMSNGTDENTIYFASNSSLITAQYELLLAKVAKNMLLDKNLVIEVVSYCDKAGNAELNKKLGQDRLNAVVNILVNRYRIEKTRIRTKYEGQINDDLGPFNRRCDITYK